jgi:NAD(P)-dependent dehydrogenase (short-subunit alcohol dehydrogenase family)
MKLVWITDNREPAACAAAKHLAERGWRVMLNDLGGVNVEGCWRVLVNLSDLASVEACVSGFGDELHGVIHPAPPPMRASIEHASDAEWQNALEGGALAAMLVTRVTGERLAALGRGNIVYLGSIHAEKPMGHGFLHSMGCAATRMLCREAALDYAKRGVCCAYVMRGLMEHDMANKNGLTNLYSGVNERYPKKRVPEPESLCGLLEFLLSDAAAPLNGADIRADEGLVMFYGDQAEWGRKA